MEKPWRSLQSKLYSTNSKVWRRISDVLGYFGWHGVGPLVVVDGNMNSDGYVNILANNFVSWVSNYPDSIFQQDGTSCHTSFYSVWWMTTHNIPILDWVVQSPDLNLIKNLWNYLD